MKPLAMWTPERPRSRRGVLYAEEPDRLVATGITRREAIEQFPHYHVCYDRDGIYRRRHIDEAMA